MSKHAWFIAAGVAVLVGWFARMHSFFLSLSLAVAGFCVFRGYRAAKDPVGRKAVNLSSATVGMDAGPPDGGQSSAQNLPQVSRGTSGRPSWGSGPRNRLLSDSQGGYAPTNTMVQQTRNYGNATSGLTFPGGVKFMPNQGAVVAQPLAASVSPPGSPTTAQPIAPVMGGYLGSSIPGNDLGSSSKNTGLSFAGIDQSQSLVSPFNRPRFN